MAAHNQGNLTATRLMILYRISRLDRDGLGVTKTEVTADLPERTAASRWKMIDELFTGGYLFRSYPQDGPPRYHLDVQGLHALHRAGADVQVGERHA